ncbi:MAG: hypothetical protein L0241_31440, partial [Planctomycetia bacterium]|nr:hypothetical protein [Planctomycetia bacterium]
MRACCMVGLFAVAFLAGSSPIPGLADEKPKVDPPAKEKQNKDREVHVVGIYEGYTKTDGKIHGG